MADIFPMDDPVNWLCQELILLFSITCSHSGISFYRQVIIRDQYFKSIGKVNAFKFGYDIYGQQPFFRIGDK